MAVSTPTDLGSAKPGSGSTMTLTTTALVPAGGKILILCGWAASQTMTGVSALSGALVGAVSIQVAAGTNSVAAAYIDCPSGLASVSVITATFSGSVGSSYIMASYVTGAGGGNGYGAVSATGTGAAWSAGATTVTSGDILYGGIFQGGSASPGDGFNTPSGGNTEIHDIGISTDSGTSDSYQLSSGSLTMQGTGYAAINDAAVAVVHAAGSIGGAGFVLPVRVPFPHALQVRA